MVRFVCSKQINKPRFLLYYPLSVCLQLQPESNFSSITEEVKQRLQETSSFLTAERKKRGKKPPEGLASPEEIQEYEQLETHSGEYTHPVCWQAYRFLFRPNIASEPIKSIYRLSSVHTCLSAFHN